MSSIVFSGNRETSMLAGFLCFALCFILLPCMEGRTNGLVDVCVREIAVSRLGERGDSREHEVLRTCSVYIIYILSVHIVIFTAAVI